MWKRVLLIVSLIGSTFIVDILLRTEQSRLELGDVITGSVHAATNGNTTLAEKLFSLRWIAYAPTGFNPKLSPPVIPSDESIRTDLKVLRGAGFDGLVTYGSDIVSIPRIAEEVGFRGLLLGIWNPNDLEEVAKAKEVATSDIVIGIIVGNEGLMFRRYNLSTLRKAMHEMKRATGKPISTTEVIESYTTNKELVEWGDFLAPNAHPFHHGVKEPRRAVEWTARAFRSFVKRAAGKPVLFKEVGLPTGGDDGLSEESQAQYYALLKQTDVKFVYFEAFDGPWKTGGTIEPHWGLFHSDRTPKPVVQVVIGRESTRMSHLFSASGWMGDGELGKRYVEVDGACRDKPHSPPTCWRLTYKAGGPKRWAAVGWQFPENNWGDKPGRNLSGYTRLVFWIRGHQGGEVVTLKLGNHTARGAPYPASFSMTVGTFTLKPYWEKHKVSLKGYDLTNVPCALVWVVTLGENRGGLTCYLDDIWLEK